MVLRIRCLLAAQVTCRIHFILRHSWKPLPRPFHSLPLSPSQNGGMGRPRTNMAANILARWAESGSDQRLRADRHGHPKGDEVLASVGATLQATLRESDFVGRYGGEEFIMILPATGREAAEVAERVTASFGVAVFPDDASDATHLVRNADRALYRAKANGRNRIEVFPLDRRTDDVKASQESAGVGWTTGSSDEGETSGIRTGQGG